MIIVIDLIPQLMTEEDRLRGPWQEDEEKEDGMMNVKVLNQKKQWVQGQRGSEVK